MKLFDIFKRKEVAYHHVYDVTDADFDVQVMQRSFKQLIMVDFWAAWCQPCRMLGPVLEKIAMEPDSPFLLAKIDSSENQATSQKFGIQSIPAVRLLRNGQMVGQFNGLQIEANIRRFVGEIMAEPPPEPKWAMPKAPKQRLQAARKHLKKGRGFEATLLLRDFEWGEQATTAQSLHTLAQFLWDVADGDALTGADAVDEAYRTAANALRRNEVGAATGSLESAILHMGDASLDATEIKELLTGLAAL